MIYIESTLVHEYGSNHPRVCYDNAMQRGTVTASSAADGFAVTNAATPFEYTGWKPTGTASDEWVRLELASAETISAMCITSHDLGTQGAAIQMQSSADGGTTWVDVGPEITPADDRPIGLLLSPRDLDDMRLVVLAGATAAPRIGVLFFCKALEFPQRTYTAQGAPSNLSTRTEYRNNMTIDGKYVGRSIKRLRERVSVPMAHIRETWIESHMTGFIEDARTNPYFLMPRPRDYPDDINYTWSQDDIIPQRMGIGGNLMEFTL